MPKQEKGIRKSCPLPYELYVHGNLDTGKRLKVDFSAGNKFFKNRSGGCPFVAYAYYAPGSVENRHYAVSPGDSIEDSWNIGDFENGVYYVRVDGPNGFMREFRGMKNEPRIDIRSEYPVAGQMPGGKIRVIVTGYDKKVSLKLRSNAYDDNELSIAVEPGQNTFFDIDTRESFGWYDFSIRIDGVDGFERRLTGRVETGKWTYTDPVIGM